MDASRKLSLHGLPINGAGMKTTIFDFKDTHSGSIFILGNGPSLDEIEDFSRLPYPTFGVNRSWRKIRSEWHFISPPDCYFKELAQGKWSADYIFTPGRIENCYLKLEKHGEHEQHEQIFDHFNFIVLPCDTNPRKRGRKKFPYVEFSMAGIMAMEIAKYMGFTVLYLLGFDGGHFGHFKTGEADHDPTFIDHDKEYHSKMWKRYVNDGIRVYNCSMESKIMTWPKKPIREIIRSGSLRMERPHKW